MKKSETSVVERCHKSSPSSRMSWSVSEQADLLWSLSSWIWETIRALNGQTTTKITALGYSKLWSCKYSQTLGTSWKIKDFPHPVGSTANTSSCLTKWSKASSYTGFNSNISVNPVSNAYWTAPCCLFIVSSSQKTGFHCSCGAL